MIHDYRNLLKNKQNAIGREVVDSAVKVHSELGPGLFESAYEACLSIELEKRGFDVKTQVVLPVRYAGMEVPLGYRADIIVEDKVLIELKAVSSVTSLHYAQLISYLKLSGISLGFLINFNVTRMKNGIKRMVNNF